MDYKDFVPSYSYRQIPMAMVGDDVNKYIQQTNWIQRISRTRSKLHDLYYKLEEHSAPNELLTQISDLEFTIGLWRNQREANSQHRRRNEMNNRGDWQPIHEIFQGIPYGVWLEECIVVVLPSEETLQWLNTLAYLYCVSNKENV